MNWDVIKELDYSEAMSLFNDFDFETVKEWKEGEYRGTTDYTISLYKYGYLLTIREPEKERYYIIKNINL